MIFFAILFFILSGFIAIPAYSEPLSPKNIDKLYKKLVHLRSVQSPQLKGASGRLVFRVEANSQAAEQGILPGDIIVSYNHKKTNAGTTWVGAKKGKKNIPLEVIRSGRLMSFKVRGGRLGIQVINEPSAQPFIRVETGMHTAEILRIDGDRSGRYIVSASRDKTLRVWSVSDGKLLKTLRVPISEENVGVLDAVAMSPNGDLIATGGWTGGWSFHWNGGHENHSIYLFDRISGEMVHRFSDSINGEIIDLTFSLDGHYLVAALGRKQGIRIWDTHTWNQVAKDTNFASSAVACDFSSDGRLIVSTAEGSLRLYDKHFALKKIKSISTKPVASVAFSPDGRRIAAGTLDDPLILAGGISFNPPVVLDSSTLQVIYHPDVRGEATGHGPMSIVAWSDDGNYLYAGSGGNSKNKALLRRWRNGGRGNYQDFHVGHDTIMALHTLRHGKIIVANADPALTLLDTNGNTAWQNPSIDVDMRTNQLRVSKDGTSIAFGMKKNSKPFIFSLNKREMISSFIDSDPLKAPDTFGLRVFSWKNSNSPYMIIKHKVVSLWGGSNDRDTSRSLAVAADRQSFLLGTEFTLRRFNKSGDEVWKQFLPGVAWGVNISGNGKLAVVALGDGTIRWYRYLDGKLLLSLFVQKNDQRWVIWTPEGFFDHSPRGENLIGFHLNKGLDSASQFISIDRLYDQLYAPDLVAKKIAGGHETELARAAREINVQRILTGGSAPSLNFISPDDGFNTKRQKVIVKLCATNEGGGIGKVIYRVNGVAMKGNIETGRGAVKLSEESDHCSSVLRRNLTLQPGENTVSVTAYNSSNEIESRPATIKMKMTGMVKAKPTLYVLAVGIDAYRDNSLKLTYSVDDATSMLDELQKQGKSLFKNIIVKPVLDKEATVAGIGKAFAELAKQVKPNDVFIFYAASHGLTVDGIYYMIPQEMVFRNIESVKQHAISKDQLTRWLVSIVAGKSLVLLDTCNSGDFINSRGLAEKAAVDKLMRATGRHTIVASLGTQAALEGYKGHGVFTYALLQGLAGQADSNGDHQVSVNELADYVADKVPEITKEKFHAEQFPMQSLQGRSFPVVLVR